MKKTWKLILILLIFCLYINVYAEDDDNTVDTNPDEEEVVETLSSVAELEDILINGEKIVCNKENVCEHHITDNDVTTVKITYKAKDNGKVDKEKIEEKLKEGINTYEVKVTSEDATKTVTYTFKIEKKILSTNSLLSKLVVNGQEIKLTPDNNHYQTNVKFSTKKIEIEAAAADENAKILDFNDGKASFNFYENSKEIKIKVQSQSGEMTTYVVVVSRREEADTSLKSLTIKNVDLEFDSEVLEYKIKVLKNVNKLDITAVPNSSKATVKLDNPSLKIGENKVKIEVSNDGNTQEYVILVTKLDEDDKTLANLKSLSIENYKIDFSPNKYEYDLKIDNVNYLVIDAIPKLEDATVEITGNLDLEDGSIIKIKVSYEDENINVYKINIYKEGGSIIKHAKTSKKAIGITMIGIIMAMFGMLILEYREKKNKKKNMIDDSNIKTTKKKRKVIENIDDVDII